MKEIVTEYVHPPIPIRDFDWSATYEDYQPGDMVGWGFTKAEAIEDLKQKTEESND